MANYYKVQSNGKAPAGLSAGDLVVTGGGTWQITGVNSDGTYQTPTMYDESMTTHNFTGQYATLGGGAGKASQSSGSGGSQTAAGGAYNPYAEPAQTEISSKKQKDSSGASGGDYKGPQQLSGRVYRVQADGNAPPGLSAGDLVVTGGGTWLITGVNDDGGYERELYKGSQNTYNYGGAYAQAPVSSAVNPYGDLLAEMNAAAEDPAGLDELRQELEDYAASTGSQFDESFWNSLISDTQSSYEGIRSSMKQSLDAQLQQTMGEYEAQRGQVNDTYDRLNRQMYVEQQQGQKNLAQVMAAQGISGGATESSALRLSNAYASNLAENERARTSDVGELERAISNARLSTTSTQAQIDAEVQQAAASAIQNLQLSMRNENLTLAQIEDSRQQWRMQLETSLAQWENEYKLAQQQYKADIAAFAYEDILRKAETLAGYGDFSGYTALGYTDKEISSMRNAYLSMLSSGSSGSSGYGGYYLGDNDGYPYGVYVSAQPPAAGLPEGKQSLEAIYNMAGGDAQLFLEYAKHYGYSENEVYSTYAKLNLSRQTYSPSEAYAKNVYENSVFGQDAAYAYQPPAITANAYQGGRKK